MVTTRSGSKDSQPDPKNRSTISGRIEKGKETTKETSKSKAKEEIPTSAKEREFEINLMRQISIGQIIFSNRFDPPWEKYTGLCLMALPRKIRDKIIVLILPINPPDQDETGAAGSNNGKKSFRGRICNSIHPILWTCRQLRYEYGQLYLANNHFIWNVPWDWDSTSITRFTQHAASIGVPDFPLTMDMATRIDGPGYKYYPHAPLKRNCRRNLYRWMKEVYYGVETRVLVNDYPLRRDDGLIAHFLHQAQQYRQHGKSWEQLQESLEEAWEAFLERRSLAEDNLGKDVSAMTALYKASNERLERARASSLAAETGSLEWQVAWRDAK